MHKSLLMHMRKIINAITTVCSRDYANKNSIKKCFLIGLFRTKHCDVENKRIIMLKSGIKHNSRRVCVIYK